MRITRAALKRLILENLLEDEETGDYSISGEQRASDYLDTILSRTHASGRPISKDFNKTITEENLQTSPVAIVNELTPSYLRNFIEKYKSISAGKMNIDMSKITDTKEVAVINSIILYTAGNVESVRSPEKYTDADADTLGSPVQNQGYGDAKYVDSRVSPNDVVTSIDLYRDRVKSGIKIPQYLLKPSKELYTIANYVLNQLGALQNSTNPAVIYRGMALPQEVIDNLKEGSIFNNKSISSWTTSKDVSQDTGKFNFSGGRICQFILENPAFGTDISHLSAFPQEEEFILGKKVRILKKDSEDLSSMGLSMRYYFQCEIVS